MNNLFKLSLLGRHANKEIVLKFGLPAILAAFAGAKCLVWFSKWPPLFVYSAHGRPAEITLVKLAIALLMILFALMEVLPFFKNFALEKKYLPLGGLLSGFFGHQGALRSAFLAKAGLSKETFLGSGVLIAVMVDITRLSVYGSKLIEIRQELPLLALAVLSAFFGARLGSRLVKKITMRSIQAIVAVLLLVIACGLASGLI